MWYLISLIIGYSLGILIWHLVHKSTIDLKDSNAIRIYYEPDTDLVQKLEIFYTKESLDEKKLEQCNVFFDQKF